jgi:hypothetical protein
MKLKVLKPHYFEGEYRNKGDIYSADIIHGKSVVKRGLCVEIKREKKGKPKRNKKEKQ